jgi:phosphotransferase system HPr (HPr) family protein
MERLKEEIMVMHPHGLHARPAALFVQLANKYNSAVRIEKDGEMVDAKSIIAILSLGINKGTKVRLIAEGEDAQETMQELKEFLEKSDV